MSEDDKGGLGKGARVPRRVLLKTLAASSLLLDPACGQSPLEDDPSVLQHAISPALEFETPIKLENKLPGTSAYSLTRPAQNGEVEGYASHDSIAARDTLRVFVNVARAQGVRCDVYRIGYYQGLGARLVRSEPRVLVSPQILPIPSAETGLVECAWQSAFAFPIETGFVNGYYLCKLTNDDGFESYVPFIVRESGRTAPLLVQASVTTWQAYNRWGDVSLYINHLPSTASFAGVRGYQVSFDRPYAPDADIGSVEWSFVRYLEQKGYDIGYVSNVDIDRMPELLQGRLLFATSGHDEYWSLGERNAIQSARDQGLSLAFFSGNTAYRRIRLEKSSSGGDRRVITCYKSGSLDPIADSDETTADTEQP
ncbi:MAG TPA: N,N-dimethylformamidase beta subunit family domain-containing protein, partial [Polyangiaceae bacterium]|nr:N,N-dimethylformamidase beta subunit family domain-containing protein [Polyangiaceae bacterium]